MKKNKKHSFPRAHYYPFTAAVLMLAGCEAPLNLEAINQAARNPVQRTDQFQALTANEHVQVAVGNEGVVLTRTSDQAAWQRQTLPGQPSLIDVEACPDNTLIALSFEKQLWRSENNGTSWQVFDIPTRENLLDLTCTPSGQYWAAGSFSTLISSNDQGRTWQENSLNEDAILTSIQFLSTSLAYTTGEFGLVARSTDNGANWEVLPPMPGEFYPQTTLFTDAYTGWSAGLDGTVLHSTDGGESWQLSPTPVETPLYGLIKGETALYALGESSTLLKLDDGRWSQIEVPARPVYLRAGLTTAGGILIAGGNGTLLSLEP